MKDIHYLVVMLLFVFFSCETTSDFELHESSIENNEHHNTNRSIDLPTETELLENNMEWAAYLTAQAIITDRNARLQFIATLNSSSTTNVIKLEDLLGSHVINPAFRIAFEERFTYFANLPDCLKCPGGRLDKPEHTNCSGFCTYLQELLDDNCLEIYLPHGFNTLYTTVSSTAHPLNTDPHNDAYIHLTDDVVFASINNLNLYSFKNPLVVRPYVDPLHGCKYDDYSGLDFTLFLQ